MRLAGLILSLLLIWAPAAGAQPAQPFAGTWDITATFANGFSSAQATLTQSGESLEGASGPLDENRYFPLTLKGTLKNGVAEIVAMRGTSSAGRLTLTLKNGALAGTGTLYGVAVTITGSRPEASATPVRVHDFTPKTFILQYSSRAAPALRIRSGDTVRTSTLDNEGRDGALQYRGMPGNTLTGPFWIEGAMPGDTLAVHIDRITFNRDTASMASGRLDNRALLAGAQQTPEPGWGRIWKLDRDKGVARPEAPGRKLAALELPLKPMIGSIGVAPPFNQALMAGDVGFHGGNMDYDRVAEGATVYFPVWQAGAFLALGDGHALQGDGEISGQGLETSLDVQFTVKLIKGDTLGQVWLEDADWVMVTGIDNGLDMSLQRATSGLSQWLKKTYGLNDSEIATLLSAAIEYDVAEIVDPRPNVVARISKAVLAGLGAP